MYSVITSPFSSTAAAAKSLQSCPTLCDPIDGNPPGSPDPGILQARTLEWVAISFSNAWKWSRSVVSDSLQHHGLQPTRLLRPWDFPGKSTGVGCHCLLRFSSKLVAIHNFGYYPKEVQAYHRDIIASVPDHQNKANITQSQSHKFVGFPVHIRVVFIPYCSLLSVQ